MTERRDGRPMPRPAGGDADESLGHGGRLNAAARYWQIPRRQWLDLSTGINPHGWPVPRVPPEVWRRLPEDDDGLVEIIRDWAGLPAGAAALPVAGSQAAIQALPRLRSQNASPHRRRVGVPAPGYREHGHCWSLAGYDVVAIGSDMGAAELETLDVVVWIQPNNPTGRSLPAQQLLEWHDRLARHGGWLVVDEAFLGDAGVESLAAHTDRDGLIVLRSLGKFFGLAGIRAGAVLAEPALCQGLDLLLGPWAVSGPTRYLMARALADQPWQNAMAGQLLRDSERLKEMLSRYGLAPSGGSLLFQYVPDPAARTLADRFARQAVLVRYLSEPEALRFGLPGGENEWNKLERALIEISQAGPPAGISIDRSLTDC